ncbi:MAG TPA: acyl-CoA dehydrogenase family protein, partial [Acidimicrobiia bacterium]|nr:acyl-CoA dehydrogenase family protein [Acidimicrobiia bacterium]
MADSLQVTYAPTEEQELIRSTARQFLEDRIGMEKVRDLMMSDDGFDPVLWKEMAEMGWTGLIIPEEHGGSGLGAVEMSVLLEEMGRMVTPGPFFASAVMATTAILELGTSAQQADLLAPLASGSRTATLAIFEQPRGWSPEAPATTARRGDGGWVIDGVKRSVLAGSSADMFLVSAAADDGVRLFVVESGADRVHAEAESVL